MNIDFQIAAPKLAALVQRAIEDRLPTLGDLGAPFALPGGTTAFVIDHLEVARVTVGTTGLPGLAAPPPTASTITGAGGAALATVEHPPVMVLATIRAPLVSLDVLAAAGSAEVPSSRMLHLELGIAFELSATAAGGAATLGLGVRAWGIRLLGSGPFSEPTAALLGDRFAELDARVRAVAQHTAIDTSAITRMLPPSFRWWAIGVALAHGVVTIRLQYEEHDDPLVRVQTVVAWSAFYGGGARDRTGGQDWALAVDASAFTRLLETQLGHALAGVPGLSILPERPPHAAWELAPAGPRLVASCGVDSAGACSFFHSDIRASVDLRVALASPRPGVVRMDLHYDIAPYAGDVFLCVLGETLIGAAIGGAIGALGGLPGLVAGAVIGGIVGLVHAFVSLGGGGTGAPIDLPGFTPTPGGDHDYFSELSLAIPGGDVFGTLAFTGLVPDADGLVVVGTFGSIATGRRARLAVDRVAPGFAWRVDGGCYGWAIVAGADVAVSDAGDLPLALWTPRLLDDSAIYGGGRSRIVRPTAPVGPHGGARVSVLVDGASAEAARAATSTPCRLLLTSTGGARVLAIPGIDAALTDADRDALARGQELACRLREADVRTRLHLDLRVVDPFGPVEWVVRARGLAAGDALTIRDRGEPVATTHAGDDGLATVRWLDASPGKRAWSATLEPADRAKLAPDAMVVAGALPLRELATMHLASPLEHLALAERDGRPVVMLADARGVATYDVANPHAPRLLALAPARPTAALPIAGAARLGGAAATLEALRAEAKRGPAGARLPPVRTHALAAAPSPAGDAITFYAIDGSARPLQ